MQSRWLTVPAFEYQLSQNNLNKVNVGHRTMEVLTVGEHGHSSRISSHSNVRDVANERGGHWNNCFELTLSQPAPA